MRKLVILLLGIMFFRHAAYAQNTVQTWTEDFDGTISFTATPVGSWVSDPTYYLPGSSTTNPLSYRGLVPNLSGNTTILQTPIYDLTGMSYVLLRFSHICKVAPTDTVLIQYRETWRVNWITLPGYSYQGKASNYSLTGFNASSYTEWRADDSLALPQASWWKNETFDLSTVTNNGQFEFRFVIKHGTLAGTQVSYGWLLENFQLMISTYEPYPPVVEFMAPLVPDTVYNTGAWEINAKVKTTSHAPIKTPWLKYITTLNGVPTANDSLLMTNVAGDSLWKASIPKFSVGSEISYSITGIDTFGNQTTIFSKYLIKMEGSVSEYHSAAIHSIGSDTIMVYPAAQSPVLVTIVNKGIADLQTAVIGWSLNGVIKPDYTWSGNLPWNFTQTDTIGYYYPKLNGRDTLVVWVRLPNNVPDTTTGDDTLTKIIYGSSDIMMAFVDYPADSVTNTGPFVIKASIRTLSGTSLNAVSLNIVTTNSSVATPSVLVMTFDAATNLWTTTIPSTLYNSNVVTSLTLTDFLGNVVILADSFYIKHAVSTGGPTGNVIIGTGTTSSAYNPYYASYEYSWSRQLYLASEIDAGGSRGGMITKLAWSYRTSGTSVQQRQTCFFQAVDETTVALTTYIDPSTAGATQVWGEATLNLATGWSEITLDQPFELPPGKNLLIYWHNNQGSMSSTHTFNTTSTSTNYRAVYRGSSVSFANATTLTGTRGYNRPNVRFFFASTDYGNTSVALEAINSPTEQTNAGVLTPVQVTIRNKGAFDLTSCLLDWTLNGVPQPTATYLGTLPEGFPDTITIGYYTPVFGQAETIVVTVSQPNGATDPVVYDDILSIRTFACYAGGMNGVYTIGTSGSANFTTFTEAVNLLKECGMIGKVTFALEGGTYPNTIDLSVLSAAIHVGDTFVLTAVSGDSVSIRPASGAGISLNNNRNIIIKDLTIDVTTSVGYGINFVSACTNIVIRDCHIIGTKTTTAASTHILINKAASTGVTDSIFIINNFLDGGYSGFYFNGGTGSTAFATYTVFDSNTVSDQYYYAIYANYIDFISFSYNNILSRQSNLYRTWYGAYFTYCNGPIVGNRIHSRSGDITQPWPIYTSYYNYVFPSPNPIMGLIANNEIMVNQSSGYTGYFGIYTATYTRANIFHNSIYTTGSGDCGGIYAMNSLVANTMAIKNNNLVSTSSASYPIYFVTTGNLNLFDLDYNNYYAPNYVGYYGKNISTLAEWKQTFTTDHSVSIQPNFADVTTSLELTDYVDLYCNPLPDVPTTIAGEPRQVFTCMGAYGAGIPDVYDLALSAIVSPANSSNAGELCLPDYSPVRFELFNTGVVEHDFFINPITLHFSITAAPNIPAFDTLVLLDIGSLKMQHSLVIELMDSYDVSQTGAYAITGWITNTRDTVPENDTLRTIYQNVRLKLSIDEDFSGGIPTKFNVRADNTPAVWQTIAQGIGTDTAVRPVFGTGMLSFVGSRGAMSTLTTQQIDLRGTIQPTLSFWYFHDTIPTVDLDYTAVYITVDGGATYNTLFSLTKYDTAYGWKEYTEDLSSYGNHSCVILAFEAMEKSPSAAITQYIDRIRVTALQDLEVSEIILPELSVCDLQNKEVKVVIHSVTNQAIDLSNTQLVVEIPDYSGSPVIIPFPRTPLEGNAYDTITLPNLVDLNMGNYVIKAYITTSVDDAPVNDTAKHTIDIRPALSVTALNAGSQASPVDAGWFINQRLTLKNTGNVALSDIRLRLLVLVNAQPNTILEETLTGITIAAGDSLSYQLSSTYFVPWTPIYGVLVEVMGCDSAKIHASTSINEYVNTDDLALLRIDNPPVTGLDTIGKQVYVKITLHNNSLVNFFTNIKATVELRGSNGAVIGFPYAEVIPDIPMSSADTSFTFTQAYTVPNDSVYTVTVFISDLYGNPIDHFRTNDTARVIRNTFNPNVGITEMGNTRISMSQNIPNPSNGTTRIDYSLPTDGEVSFYVYTISGQELFNKVVETTSGKHSIELNTTSLASGIYFYSMEFKGQRIVKRMSVAL